MCEKNRTGYPFCFNQGLIGSLAADPVHIPAKKGSGSIVLTLSCRNKQQLSDIQTEESDDSQSYLIACVSSLLVYAEFRDPTLFNKLKGLKRGDRVQVIFDRVSFEYANDQVTMTVWVDACEIHLLEKAIAYGKPGGPANDSICVN